MVPNSWPMSMRRAASSASRPGPRSSRSSVGNGPEPDAGHVGLGDADHVGDVARAEPGSRERTAGHRVGGGHERIGAVIEVQQRPLRPLQQDRLAALQRLVQQHRGVGDVGAQALGVDRVLGLDVGRLHRQAVVDAGEDRVLLAQDHVELLAEDLHVVEVLDAQADPRRLVGVGRPDAAPGGAQPLAAQVALRDRVELAVVGHDQVRVAGDLQLRRVDALRQQVVELLQEHPRVDHDAVADDRRDVPVEHTAGDQVQLERGVADDDRVPGVVAALVAHDVGHLVGQQVGGLALALVTPLRSDDDDGRHPTSSTSWRSLPPTPDPAHLRRASLMLIRSSRGSRRACRRPGRAWPCRCWR